MTDTTKPRVEVRSLIQNELKRPERVEEKRQLESEFYDREAADYLQGFREADLRREVEDFEVEVNTPASLAPVLKIRYAFSLLGDLHGKRVLEPGCGMGVVSCVLGRLGAQVTGIDVSAGMIDLARRNVALHQLDGQVDHRVMSAESLEFPDESFDLVFGFVCRHHLQPTLAAREFRRVLRPGGRAIFVDPIQGSRFLARARARVPVECLESPGGGSLSPEDIREVGRHFDRVAVKHFECFARFDRLIRWDPLVRAIYRMDARLLGALPPLRKYSRYVVLEFTRAA
jgi:SAM-dependent methyltransferase